MDEHWWRLWLVGCLSLSLAACAEVATERSSAGPVATVLAVAGRLQAQHEVAVITSADVVAVRAEGCGGGRTRASGFVVDGLVVTNAHVADGAATIDVVGPRWSASPLVSRVGGGEGGEVGPDLAVAPVGVGSGLAWAARDAPIGTPVVLAGRASGSFRWRPGRVHLYSEPGGFGGVGVAMLVDGASGPGFSGGPVVDLDGRVVGVLRAVDLATGLTVAIPVSEYRSWRETDKYGDSSTSCLQKESTP
ncbi:MAG: serine protease [Actinomycetota bacterium]